MSSVLHLILAQWEYKIHNYDATVQSAFLKDSNLCHAIYHIRIFYLVLAD